MYFGVFKNIFIEQFLPMLVRLLQVMLEYIVTVLIVKITSYTIEESMVIVKHF